MKLLPRMKYVRPFNIARPVTGSNRNSRMPKRVTKRSVAAIGFQGVKEGIFRRPQPTIGDGNADIYDLFPRPLAME